MRKLKRKKQTLTNGIGHILNKLAVHSFGYGAFLIDEDGNFADEFLDEEAECNKDIEAEEMSEQFFETL